MYYYFLSGYMIYNIYRNYFIIEDILFWSKTLYKLTAYLYSYMKKNEEQEWIML
jgi:hypothetical protein